MTSKVDQSMGWEEIQVSMHYALYILRSMSGYKRRSLFSSRDGNIQLMSAENPTTDSNVIRVPVDDCDSTSTT